MRDCAWPQGCFQCGESDDPDGLCFYHRKVLNGLITDRLPDSAEAALIEMKKRQKDATGSLHTNSGDAASDL